MDFERGTLLFTETLRAESIRQLGGKSSSWQKIFKLAEVICSIPSTWLTWLNQYSKLASSLMQDNMLKHLKPLDIIAGNLGNLRIFKANLRVFQVTWATSENHKLAHRQLQSPKAVVYQPCLIFNKTPPKFTIYPVFNTRKNEGVHRYPLSCVQGSFWHFLDSAEGVDLYPVKTIEGVAEYPLVFLNQ